MDSRNENIWIFYKVYFLFLLASDIQMPSISKSVVATMSLHEFCISIYIFLFVGYIVKVGGEMESEKH